ncbi:sigma-70 family RNA polymerase sigma factor [Kribbella shirazensis]|uniref:RNA polymerase sigma-70 factor (ECF subfamily) n=1 Tax=Kribbella shirazensis TaxID=1105143 RepID=A0A7X6A4Y4_9ACTN|nr:sigma-70 family RNA polymerase sigma factor [Kribbella shirazensis]NIK61383.1 RNA polymerase sigma-70 factor (ECF subfamily) [Kribbella shirazensis]
MNSSRTVPPHAPVDTNTPWDDLVRDHLAQVYRISCGLTHNRHDAWDLTQDVFVQVFHNIATYTPQNFDGWLYRITVNLFRSQVRRNRQVQLHQLGEDVVDLHTTRQRGPDELLAERVVDNDIRAALADLPSQYRVAVLLRDIDGLSNAEIATVLDIKRGTVGSRLHRGHARLRAALAHRAPTAPQGVQHA